MKNSSLRRELLWFVFAVGAAVLALGAWGTWERRAEMVAERKTELRHVLDLAAGIVRNGKQSVREGMPVDEAKRNVARRLAQLRVPEDLLARKPEQVSGGELQRIALARVLTAQPALLFADEPTSRLDPITQQEAIETLLSATQETGAALMLVTHDAHLAAAVATRTLHLQGA